MEKVLKRKIENLEKELIDIKDYTYRDIITCEKHIRNWRNKFLRLKNYCINHYPQTNYIIRIIEDDKEHVHPGEPTEWE